MRDAITLRNIHNSHLKPRYTKDIPTRVCAECAQAHARRWAILALATLALGATTSLRSPSQDPRARYARARCPPFPPFPLPIPSVPPPNSLQLPRSLRSLGLPASYARGKPPCSVVRARETAAQSTIHLPKPKIPSVPPPTRSLRSLVAAPCRHYAHVTADACYCMASNRLHSRYMAAVRSNRLQAAIQPPAHCLSATALCYAHDSGLRAPTRSRFARFVAALRSRVWLI